jgi:signal transduction histidine kinase
MSKLGTLLRAQRDAILAEWLRRVREQPEAEHMPEPVLRDNLPQIIDEIAECLDRYPDCRPGLDALPTLHALDRYKIGFDVRDVVSEYRILRQVILSRISRASDREGEACLHELLDRAISDAVDHFALERDRAREVFVGMLGHDLRGPLNAISMAAQHLLIQEDRLDPAHARLVKRVLSSVTRIDRMADDMLDFTRGRVGGGVPIKVAPADLASLIRDVTDEFHEAFPDRRVETRLEGEQLEGDWDADRLAQVVSNLIANALEHGTDPVEVGTRQEGEQVVIEVRNRGELARDAIGRVFDPFVSLAPTRAGRRGLGLGLYIVREVAKAHGGSVEATSGNGTTTFRVVLPRLARPAAQQ